MQKKIIALAVAATFFVTACGNDHSDAKQLPAQASAPVQQAAAAAPAAAEEAAPAA
jgi:protein involved in sex pheromone biosynthesis